MTENKTENLDASFIDLAIGLMNICIEWYLHPVKTIIRVYLDYYTKEHINLVSSCRGTIFLRAIGRGC